MFIIFTVGVVWLLYVYFGYPALLAILGKLYAIRPSRSTDILPHVSVLLSARNEKEDIGWKLAETLVCER